MKEYKIKEGIEQEHLEKPPFTMKYLDEEKQETGSEIITIRLNAQERATINKLKECLHYSQDAKVIKTALIIGYNVIHTTLGFDLMDKLCDENRRRSIFDDAKEIQKA